MMETNNIEVATNGVFLTQVVMQVLNRVQGNVYKLVVGCVDQNYFEFQSGSYELIKTAFDRFSEIVGNNYKIKFSILKLNENECYPVFK